MIALANTPTCMYRFSVAANSANGFGSPISKRRNSAPITIAGAFFTPAIQCYGGCAWKGFGPAGFRLLRSTNPRTAVTQSFSSKRGSSSQVNGAPPMQLSPTRNPSTPSTRAAAFRAMAFAALHADSSLAVRLTRYNAHMARARQLEAQEATQ